MHLYFFVIEATPKPENNQAKEMAGAEADIFVFAESKEQAEDRAIRYLNNYGWHPVKVLIANENPEIPPATEKLLRKAHRLAESQGIGANVNAWPKIRTPGRYQLDRLKKPDEDSAE